MIYYDFLDSDNVLAGFTERWGGVSAFPENSLNLSFSREPSKENVLENFRRAAAMLGVSFESLTNLRQVHGSDVCKVTSENSGSVSRGGADDTMRCDAMITDVPGITLCTTHADCTPVLLYDPVNKAIGAIHSGWRGTAKKISAETVRAMEREYGTVSSDLRAVIGPAICRKCFEIDRDAYDILRESFGSLLDESDICSAVLSGDKVKWHVDTPELVRRTLIAAGVKEENILRDKSCTSCEERFFSHRRDHGNTGCMISMIQLKH